MFLPSVLNEQDFLEKIPAFFRRQCLSVSIVKIAVGNKKMKVGTSGGQIYEIEEQNGTFLKQAETRTVILPHAFKSSKTVRGKEQKILI